MQKEIKVIDKEKGVVRITTTSERWYTKPGVNATTGLPELKYLPSATWISSYYPKGLAFYKWLADKGWDEAEAIKSAAGNKGSKVHKGTEIIEKQGSISIDTVFRNEETEVMEILTTEELECLMSFARWHDATKPELLANEITVFGDFYAGTLDRIYRIAGQVWIIDLKTGQHIWTEQELQISAYSHANIDYKALGISDDDWAARKLATLQLGYRMNKNKYKFTEIEDKFDLFQVAYKIWQHENQNGKPKEIEIPLVIKIQKGGTNGQQPNEAVGQGQKSVPQVK